MMLVVVALTGCAESVAWDKGVRPVAAPGSSAAFTARVDAAVLLWQQTLGCGDVFSGATGTGPVYEKPESEFAAMNLGRTVSGETWPDRVWINSARPELEDEVLVHELGHVLGLDHVEPAEDPASVMHPIDDGIVIPDVADVERVGCR